MATYGRGMTFNGPQRQRSWLTHCATAGLMLCIQADAIARDFDLTGSAAAPELVASSPWQPPVLEVSPVVEVNASELAAPAASVLEWPADASAVKIAEEAASSPWPPPVEQTDEPVVEMEPQSAPLEQTTIELATEPVTESVGERVADEPTAVNEPAIEAAPTANNDSPLAPSMLSTVEADESDSPENEEYLAALDADLSQSFVSDAAPPLPVLHAPLPSETLPSASFAMEVPAQDVQVPAAPPVVTPYSPTTAELTRQLLPSIQHAYGLARHGAVYAARAEFIQVLRRIAQSKDAAANSDVHSQSLAAALRALDEADDFAPHGTQLEGELDVTLVATAHRTPVLEQCAAPPRPVEAIALYHEYARHQFARAVAGEQAGSAALYGLGKMHNRLASGAAGDVGQERKALVLFLAALDVAPGNHLAANEVGVLFARGGRAWEASIVFRHALDVAPSATTYHNLAVVDRQLGYHDQASANEYYAQQLATRDRAGGAASQTNGVRWVAPQEMGRTAQPLPIEGNQNWARNRLRPMPQHPPAGQFETTAPSYRAAQWPQKLIPGVFRR